jgi:hypothetical protein
MRGQGRVTSFESDVRSRSVCFPAVPSKSTQKYPEEVSGAVYPGRCGVASVLQREVVRLLQRLARARSMEHQQPQQHQPQSTPQVSADRHHQGLLDLSAA